MTIAYQITTLCWQLLLIKDYWFKIVVIILIIDTKFALIPRTLLAFTVISRSLASSTASTGVIKMKRATKRNTAFYMASTSSDQIGELLNSKRCRGLKKEERLRSLDCFSTPPFYTLSKGRRDQNGGGLQC